MQAQALIQLGGGVAVAAIAPGIEAGLQPFGSAIVASGDHSIFGVDNHCPYRCLHAIGSPPCDVGHLHKVLIPGWPEWPHNLFRFAHYLLFKFPLLASI